MALPILTQSAQQASEKAVTAASSELQATFAPPNEYNSSARV